MSTKNKKLLEKTFQVKDPKEKWKLIYQFYDEKALRIIDSQLIVENKDFLIKTLNEFNEKIDAKLKKSKPHSSLTLKMQLKLLKLQTLGGLRFMRILKPKIIY